MENTITKDQPPRGIEKRSEHSEKAGDATWSNISQELHAPGIKSDAKQQASTNDSKSLPSGFPKDLEITGMAESQKVGDAATDRSKDPAQVVRNDHPQTVDEVMQSLNKLQKALPDNDGLKYFNSLYQSITQGVKDQMARGGFEDPKYIEKLCVNFANMYLDAVKDNLQGKPLPGAWKDLFSERHNPNIAPIQFAAAGIMAHIAHDLPYALEKTNNDLGINPDKNSPQRHAFEQFNQVLRDIIPQAMDSVNKGGLGHLAHFSGAAGREAILLALREMRDGAWEVAGELHKGGMRANLTAVALEKGADEAATQVLHPGRIPIPGIGHIPNPYTEIPIIIANRF